MSALHKAIEILGSQSALALAIGRAPQVVNNWVRRGNVPAECCPEIERATSGQVRCDVLRPAVDWGYLRGSETAHEPTPSPKPSPRPASGPGAKSESDSGAKASGAPTLAGERSE